MVIIRIARTGDISTAAIWSGICHLGLIITGMTFVARLANGDSDSSISSSTGTGSAYPGFMMTLPASDRWLVFMPMLFAFVSLAGLFGLYAVLIAPAFQLPTVLGWAVFTTSLTISLQALAWSKIEGRYTKIVLACALMFGEVPVGGYLLFYQQSLLLVPELYAGIACISIVLGVPGFAKARHGRPERFLRAKAASGRLGKARVSVLPRFRSGFHTLTWIGWRRQGMILPIITLIACFGFVLLQLLDPSQNAQSYYGVVRSHEMIKPSVLVFLIIGIAFLTGATPRKNDLYSPDLLLQPFFSTRPQSSVDFIKAILRFSVKSALATTLILGWTLGLLATVSHVPTDSFGFGLREDFFAGPLGGTLPALLCLVTLFLLVWNLQTFLTAGELSGRRLVSYVPVALLAGFCVLATTALYPAHSEWVFELFRAVVWVLIGLNTCVAGLAAFWLIRRKLASMISLGLVTILWVFCAGWLAAGYAAVFPNTGGFVFYAPYAMLMTPFTRFLVAPIMLEWNRHR
jgi:hypothetical protein